MPLKSYQKSNHYAVAGGSLTQVLSSNTLRIIPDTYNAGGATNRFTMWDLIISSYQALKDVVASSTAAGMIIPVLFIFVGLGFIALQILPDQIETLKSANNFYEKGSTPLVQLSYIENKEQFVSNPGADYFRELSNSAIGQGGFFEDQQSLNYQGTFYITIDSLGIKRLPVSANVDSGNENTYRSVLNTKLAHFRGSSLPHSDTPGNVVIYGHSTGGSYRPSPQDPVSAFTLLADLQVGDIIKIEQNGKTYKYRMVRSKRVKPADTSILLGTPGRDSLTLFTCWGYPTGGPGNRSGRLVVTAVPV